MSIIVSTDLATRILHGADIDKPTQLYRQSRGRGARSGLTRATHTLGRHNWIVAHTINAQLCCKRGKTRTIVQSRLKSRKRMQNLKR